MFGNKYEDPMDELFDFNRDGKLNSSERAYKYDYMESFLKDDDDEDDNDLDLDDLDLMDPDERREALEEAGLDPDDYDDLDDLDDY